MSYVTDAAREYAKTHDSFEDLKESLIDKIAKAQPAFDEAKKIAESIKQASYENMVAVDPELRDLLEDFDSAMQLIEHCIHA